MNLYERDYSQLTPDEEAAREAVIAAKSGVFGSLTLRSDSLEDYDKPARHSMQLFPNNFLDPLDLKDTAQLTDQLLAFEALVNTSTNDLCEMDVLAFIRENRAYFIIGSILKDNYRFGHHGAFLFPEFQLGTSYKADYLIVGESSGGWEFVFVEFEAPVSQAVLQDGELGGPFRKGIKQIQDWKHWLEAYFSGLREVFEKAKRCDASLPGEFINLDTTRLHFVVVAGRRSDFKDRTYRLRRVEDGRVLLLHFDNLIDCAKSVIGSYTY